MASNYATGGINVAALEHFTQIKGGWGAHLRDADARLDHRDDAARQHGPRQNLARTRPWMLMMPPETPPYVAVSQERRAAARGEAPDRRAGQDQDGRQQRPHGAGDRPRDAGGAPAARPRRPQRRASTCCSRIPATSRSCRRRRSSAPSSELTASQRLQDRGRRARRLRRFDQARSAPSTSSSSTDCGQTGNVYPDRLPGAGRARAARQRHHPARDRSDVQGQSREAAGPAAAGDGGVEQVDLTRQGARRRAGWPIIIGQPRTAAAPAAAPARRRRGGGSGRA